VIFGQTLLSSISGLLNFILLPAVFVLIKRFNELSASTKLVFVFIMTYLAMIAFSYHTQFTRHRVLVEIPVYIIFLKYSTVWLPTYKKSVQAAAIFMFITAFSVIFFLQAYKWS